MLVKKVTLFGKLSYLNSSCIRQSVILMFLSSSRVHLRFCSKNSVTDVSVGFRPSCWRRVLKYDVQRCISDELRDVCLCGLTQY